MQPLSLLGPVDALAPFAEYVVLAFVVLNLITRHRAHYHHVRQADRSDEDEEIVRSRLHEASNLLVVLAAFYLATFDPHKGVMLSVLVVGMVVTDFFEFEARKVEARKGDPLDRPKGAIFASLMVFVYAAFLALFHFVAGPVGAII